MSIFIMARLQMSDVNKFQINIEYYDTQNNRKNSIGIMDIVPPGGTNAKTILGGIEPAVLAAVDSDNGGGGTASANDIFWTA
jgi:hypothetical protein